MKTYVNKSNAKRAALVDGKLPAHLVLLGKEGAWYYGPGGHGTPGEGKTFKIENVLPGPDDKMIAGIMAKVGCTREQAITSLAKAREKLAAAPVKAATKKAPAKPAKATKPAAKPAKKAPAKKAAKAPAKPAKKVAAKTEYDPKNGPTQGRITGYHIDEDRPTKHGQTKRSTGTIGGRLWAIYDKLAKGKPAELAISTVKESAQIKDVFNANKVVIEFYCWRKYNGVRGRGKKQKVS